MFKIRTRYYLELLMSETMKLLGSTKSKITNLEIIEIVLIHCNIVNNNYQQKFKTLVYTFVPNKSFGPLLDNSPKILYF